MGYKFKVSLEATQHGVTHVPCGEYSSFEGSVLFSESFRGRAKLLTFLVDLT